MLRGSRTRGNSSVTYAKVQRESAAVLQLPASRKTLGADGVLIVASSPEDFSRYIKSEMAKWANVVKAAGIKPEG
jgi:tripartite-type tricarboxylate transporter receptor subunit TctC